MTDDGGGGVCVGVTPAALWGDCTEPWAGVVAVPDRILWAEVHDDTDAAGDASGLGVDRREGLVTAAAAAVAAARMDGSPPAASRAKLAAASRSRASSVEGSIVRGLRTAFFQIALQLLSNHKSPVFDKIL